MTNRAGINSPRFRSDLGDLQLKRIRTPSPVLPPQLRRNDAGYKHFKRGPPSRGSSTARYVCIGIAVLGGGYYVAHLERAPYTGRLRMIDLSRDMEIAIGNTAFEELLSGYRDQVLPPNHSASRRVREIGVRIAREVKRTRPELLEGFKWKFVVVEDPGNANAACVPGGKVVVFSGMLAVASNDDELAAVMAHEISHAVLRHSAERLSFAKVLFVMQVLLSTFLDFGGMTHMLVHLIMNLPYSRKLEREADIVGLKLMTDACYDPAASPRMFESLSQMQLDGKKETRASNMLSTHPMFADRIKALDKDVPEQRMRYEDKCERQWSSWKNSVSEWDSR